MNKQDVENLREFMAWYTRQTGSQNTYRMAWALMKHYPHLAVAVIKAKLLEIRRESEE